MEKLSCYDDLMWRGLIKDISSPEIEKLLNEEKVTFYWGTDPTADSLHLGHYSSLVTAKRLSKYGHNPILLCGGATGLIGDPRPTSEREIISYEAVRSNIDGIRNQIDKIFEGKAKLVDNYDWTKNYSYLDFLRDIGKYINVNYMLDKDIIRRRLETGITYAEFSYTLIQGNDFLELFQRENCIMQVEGSDQWGNITTGIELIKKKLGKEAYGFTMPLILDAQGKKFGKSEGNALWLDKEKTSPYKIYQYFVNTDDRKVVEYLKVFTFLSKEEIESLEEKLKTEPEKREAQKALAYEVVKDLHGKEEADKAMQAALDVFSGKISDDMPSFKVENDKYNILDLLVLANLCSSKSDARRTIIQGGVKVNNEKVLDENLEVSIDNTIIQRGKKNIVKIEKM